MGHETNNALMAWESPDALSKRVQRMLEIQQSVMRSDIDYGIIPGCKKPSLYKPGAELLMVTFALADRINVEDVSEDGAVRYRVTTEIYSQASGAYLGCGVGEASTDEEKYKWRKAVCDGEYDAADILSRREKWYSNGDTVKQVRTNPADVANTVLKMAKKRSKIDAVLSVLGASRIYSQDIEDMSKELQEIMKDGNGDRSTKPAVTKPTVPVSDVPADAYLVQAVSKKDGVKDGKPWTKYGIKINGEFYGTFSDTNGAIAEKAMNEKTLVTFTWAQSGKYKNLDTITPYTAPVVAPTPEPAAAPQVRDQDDFAAEIKSLAAKAKIDNVDQFLQEQLKINSIADVPADKQGTVMDLFLYHAEGNK